MNKYFIILIIVVAVIVGGIIYRVKFLPESSRPVETGAVKEFTITAKANEWRFVPEDIAVTHGDRVILTVINEDDYDHGIAIDALGISQKMPANETIKVEFVATQQGDFPFYCSVPCGDGEVNGEPRDHFSMIGTIKVTGAIQVN